MTLDQRGSLAPYIKDDIEYYPHQLEGIRKLAFMKSFLLADDMGLGKSLQALTVLGIDVYMGKAKSAVVICPATLKGNWIDELEKFTGFKAVELGYKINRKGRPAAMSKEERSTQIALFAKITEPKVLVMNYEQVGAHLKELQDLKFDVSIFDEAHYLKNPKSQRTKNCMQLTTFRSFLLTGSPMLNRVDELWPLLYRINPEMYADFWSFRARYCVMGGWKNKEIIGVQNEQELTMRLQSVMLRRMKEDVLKLKKPYIVTRKVDLSPLQQKMYDEVLNELQLTLPSDPNPMEIENGMTRFLRLKQICATTATLDGGTDESNKLDLAISDATEMTENGNKVIVFTQFREAQAAYIRRARTAMPGVPIFELNGDVPIPQRQPLVKEWSAVEGPALIVCMLQVAGVGLNMVAARHLQFIDKLFVPDLNKQAIDRAHRIGADETQTVQVFEYITRNTVEARIEDILKTKKVAIKTIVGGGAEDTSWKRRLIEETLRGE